jgi:hypothetical protein
VIVVSGELAEYVQHYDGHRPDQALQQESPLRESGHAVDITARSSAGRSSAA